MRTRLAAVSTAAAAAALIVASATPAHAAAVGTTGAAQIVPAPPSLAKNAFESDTQVKVIDESSVNLTASLTIWNPGPNNTMTSTTYAAKTCLQSHMLHFDQVGAGTNATLTGTASFSQPVIGLLPINTPIRALDTSDASFGAVGTTYAAPNDNARGFELNLPPLVTNGDSLSLPAPDTVGFTFRGDGWDEVRVLTLCDPTPVVPEVPLSMLLPLSGAAVLTGFVVTRRRRLAVA